MNNEIIIEFGFRIEREELCFRSRRLSSTSANEYILFGLHNSSYHTQPQSVTVAFIPRSGIGLIAIMFGFNYSYKRYNMCKVK